MTKSKTPLFFIYKQSSLFDDLFCGSAIGLFLLFSPQICLYAKRQWDWEMESGITRWNRGLAGKATV